MDGMDNWTQGLKSPYGYATQLTGTEGKKCIVQFREKSQRIFPLGLEADNQFHRHKAAIYFHPLESEFH